jgi:hypothetical protein
MNFWYLFWIFLAVGALIASVVILLALGVIVDVVETARRKRGEDNRDA